MGIDPGLAGTGVGVVSGTGTLISGYSFGSIETQKEDALGLRLDAIYTKIVAFLSRQKPDLVILEEIFSLEKFPRSGILLGKVSGVLLLAAYQSGSRVEEISVREAKKIVSGTGNADKYQVERSVKTILDHPGSIRPFHASDALALALAGLFRAGRHI